MGAFMRFERERKNRAAHWEEKRGGGGKKMRPGVK